MARGHADKCGRSIRFSGPVEGTSAQMFRGKNEGEPARAGATHTAGLQVGMWPTSGKSWSKRFVYPHLWCGDEC